MFLLFICVSIHKWKNRFPIQTGEKGKGGREKKEVTPRIYGPIWKHGMAFRGSAGSQIYNVSLKQAVFCFIYVKPCMETISLATAYLWWIKYNTFIFFQTLSCPKLLFYQKTLTGRDGSKENPREREPNVLLTCGWLSCLYDASNILQINYSFYHKRELWQIGSSGFHWSNCEE